MPLQSCSNAEDALKFTFFKILFSAQEIPSVLENWSQKDKVAISMKIQVFSFWSGLASQNDKVFREILKKYG